jgi:ATP-binding cassette, subfamily B, bacterial MsbA
LRKLIGTLFDPRLLRELSGHRRSIVLGLMCSAVAALITSAVMPLFIKLVVDAVEQGRAESLKWFALAVLGIVGVKYWFARGQAYYLGKAAVRLTTELRMKVFAKLQRLPLGFFNTKRSGAIQSVLTHDVNVYSNAISAARDAVDGPVKIIGGATVIFLLQWKLALACLVIVPPLILLIQRNGKRIREAQSRVQGDLGHMTAMMQESLQGTRVIKAFSAEDRIEGQFSALNESAYNSQVQAIKRFATLRPMVELLGATALALVLVMCARLVAQGELSVAQLMGFLVGLDVINQGAKSMGVLNQTLSQVRAATDRIYEEVLSQEEQPLAEPGSRELTSPQGRIEFKNVGFVYPDGTRALSNVSFVIEPGTSLALVGRSGSGKSTIGDLLLRFYEPSEGQILFDGVDLRELKVSWLRSQVGVVPQHTFLFAGSIEENIKLGAPGASHENVLQAARAAHADTFIDHMPNTYSTELGERGIRLSGGEMQRIAIARAIIRKPTMLLLDEATSSLDAESEKAVQEALYEVMKERTTLFIAHRLTSAARADKILMLNRGEVIEYGTHRELMELKGSYAAMYRAFSSGVIDESVV